MRSARRISSSLQQSMPFRTERGLSHVCRPLGWEASPAPAVTCRPRSATCPGQMPDPTVSLLPAGPLQPPGCCASLTRPPPAALNPGATADPAAGSTGAGHRLPHSTRRPSSPRIRPSVDPRRPRQAGPAALARWWWPVALARRRAPGFPWSAPGDGGLVDAARPWSPMASVKHRVRSTRCADAILTVKHQVGPDIITC
jgi:hypothetical protein